MNKEEYLKLLKEQSEANSKTMSDTARAIGFAIIGFTLIIHSNTKNITLTYIFLSLLIVFFIIDFTQYLYMWRASKKLFLKVKAGKIESDKADSSDKKNKKVTTILIFTKLMFLGVSLSILGYVIIMDIIR